MKVVDSSTEPFERAVRSVRSVRAREEFHLEEIPAPTRLAPHALAMTAELADPAEDLASRRFVLLHDPDGIEEWEGTFRAVIFVRADLESDLLDDPLITEVTWSWLTEALHGLPVRQVGGTVTKSTGDAFGTMRGKRPTGSIELRASWTPVDSADSAMADHVQVWLDTLAVAGGLTPLPVGVVGVVPHRRG